MLQDLLARAKKKVCMLFHHADNLIIPIVMLANFSLHSFD